MIHLVWSNNALALALLRLAVYLTSPAYPLSTCYLQARLAEADFQQHVACPVSQPHLSTMASR